jgi:HSP20 family molecular chaperone IbpA
MSLIHHNLFEPYERSFFDDPFFREFDREVLSFDDDTSKPKNHHHLISTKHKHFPHHIWHHHHKEDDRNQDPFHKVKKQMTKAFDKDVFKMVDFCPSINISEDDKAFYIHADLPGMTKDQVKIEWTEDDRILTISGERKAVNNHSSDDNNNKKLFKHNNSKKFSKMECYYGRFERSFTVPENADLDSVQAKMENGVLEISVKKIKPDVSHTHRIEIQ